MLTSFLLDSRMPRAELMAARIDGDVRSIGSSHLPTDVPSTPELRAAALGLIVPRGVVVEGRAAAWVHGVLPAPSCIVAGRPVSIRPTRGPSSLVIRQVTYPDDDVTHVGTTAVTSAVRTALDLARQESAFDLRLATSVATLLSRAGIDPARARTAVSGRTGMPYRLLVLDRLTAVERLARDLGQPPVTR
ncbi:hypothetical protein NY547_06465 [Cnuibacter physcomitrellae]|uniref:hypothetical protein n=1 Tax=Cnuibacter physcomitrellae TaxID=1619308 RepID=UPI0021761741|nr:hypothetical protein [Cnuibacter physcomitrellae]MCS5496877.1 hypothetical protein [Cnuibacter physcomitrellae]